MQHSSIWLLGGLAAVAAFGSAIAWSGARETMPMSALAKTMPKKASGPVVLELFTSQGCSSCPPADALASRLARDPALVVITRPVTYWDRLGWKDTLALEANTLLQRAYAQRGNEGAGVYTPQIVVNGRHGAVGSQERQITMLVRDAQMEQRPVLAQSLTKDGSVRVTVKGKVPAGARMSLMALASHRKVAIGRGENGGRTVSYTNVLRAETPLAPQGSEPSSYAISKSQMQRKDADRYAVILRRGTTGPIIAARML